MMAQMAGEVKILNQGVGACMEGGEHTHTIHEGKDGDG